MLTARTSRGLDAGATAEVPTFVLGRPTGDALVRSIVDGIEAAGGRVVVVDFDPTERDDRAHETRLGAAAARASGEVIIGGFSIGARIAARLCPEIAPLALFCLGYPFHRAGDPNDRHGLETLLNVTAPTRVIQGTRDNHGTESEVRSYPLPGHIEMIWLSDGNHRFVPRPRSGHTYEEHLETATAAAIELIRGR